MTTKTRKAKAGPPAHLCIEGAVEAVKLHERLAELKRRADTTPEGLDELDREALVAGRLTLHSLDMDRLAELGYAPRAEEVKASAEMPA